ARLSRSVLALSLSLSVTRPHSAIGNTNRQRSWPLVITRPPSNSLRNLAGSASRPLSSSRGVWVPRNTTHPLPVVSSHYPHFDPPYPTLHHRQLEHPCLKQLFPSVLGTQQRWGRSANPSIAE